MRLRFPTSTSEVQTVVTLNYSGTISGSTSVRVLLSPYLMAIGFIDTLRAQAELNAITLDSNASDIKGWLTGFRCTETLGSWAADGAVGTNVTFTPITSLTGRRTANALLGVLTGDPEPPEALPSAWEPAGGFRMLQQAQFGFVFEADSSLRLLSEVAFRTRVFTGGTPDPCLGLFVSDGQTHPAAGRIRREGTLVGQLNQVRVGSIGQAGNRYTNWRDPATGVYDPRSPAQLMPWVWALIQVSTAGVVQPFVQDSGNQLDNTQIFPTIKLYRLGPLGWQSVARQIQQDFNTLLQLPAVCFRNENCVP